MTLPEKLNYMLRRRYYIEYTIYHDLIIRSTIRVTELAKIKNYLKRNKIDYRNIIIK